MPARHKIFICLISVYYTGEEIGQSVVKEYCTEGLVFNEDTEMCDYPKNVECPASPIPTQAPGQCEDYKVLEI